MTEGDKEMTTTRCLANRNVNVYVGEVTASTKWISKFLWFPTIWRVPKKGPENIPSPKTPEAGNSPQELKIVFYFRGTPSPHLLLDIWVPPNAPPTQSSRHCMGATSVQWGKGWGFTHGWNACVEGCPTRKEAMEAASLLQELLH